MSMDEKAKKCWKWCSHSIELPDTDTMSLYVSKKLKNEEESKFHICDYNADIICPEPMFGCKRCDHYNPIQQESQALLFRTRVFCKITNKECQRQLLCINCDVMMEDKQSLRLYNTVKKMDAPLGLLYMIKDVHKCWKRVKITNE
jgi:hypothetical protein